MTMLAANIELLALCLTAVCLLFGFNFRYWKPRILNPLSVIYILVGTGCVTEMFAFWADGKPWLVWMNYLGNILYLGGIGLMAVCMLSYCNEQFPQKIWKNQWQHFLLLLPAAAELTALVLAPVCGTVFTITPEGYYQRTGTFFLQMIPYGYLTLTTVLGVHWYLHSETTKEKSANLVISLFAIPSFVLGLLQVFLPANQLELLTFGFVLSLLSNFAVTLRNRITRDPLTRLPNREVLDEAIRDSIRDYRRGNTKYVFVIMGDMDGFKSINDTYGHLEGDRALITSADKLYEICDRMGMTVARFGGDEFSVVGETDRKDTPEKLIADIERGLEEISSDDKYLLRMSMGYAFYEAGMTIQDLLKAADHELYRVKQERKRLTI